MTVFFRMAPVRSPLKRYVLHSLWVILPFCGLLALTWNAWRSDAETRRTRLLESAVRFADQALQETTAKLGPWTSIPATDSAVTPPLPDDAPKAIAAMKRYEAGDFEGVLGSPESLRSAAGLPLRSLAALQLLRLETDPERLAELASVLTGSMDFTTPLFLEDAESRFAQLKLASPPTLVGWRDRWQRARAESALRAALDESTPASWQEIDATAYLVEIYPASREWRVSTETDVRAAASVARSAGNSDLAQNGLSLRLNVAGRIMAGPAGRQEVLGTAGRDPWRAEVVLANQAVFLRGDARTKNFMTGVLAVAGLAVAFGLVLSGRATLRAVELARRQAGFMAAVSHEMRTPLAAMGLLAENLESGVADRAGQRDEHTRLIREECARLGGLVDNVLAFTRGGKPEPYETFDVAAMIDDAVALVKPMAYRRNIAIHAAASDFPDAPSGDVAALRRALLNLLDNALKHTPDGGNVICRADSIAHHRWTLEICDSGPGIPISERSRIFDAFYRIGDELRRTTPGTGLGLALVKRTAEAHGAIIAVDDAPDGGARFTLSLPMHPPEKNGIYE
jgi:signal transduction histidine kinase